VKLPIELVGQVQPLPRGERRNGLRLCGRGHDFSPKEREVLGGTPFGISDFRWAVGLDPLGRPMLNALRGQHFSKAKRNERDCLRKIRARLSENGYTRIELHVDISRGREAAMNGLTSEEAGKLYGTALRIAWKTGRSFGKRAEEVEECCDEIFIEKLLGRLPNIPVEKREAFVGKTTKWEARRYFRRQALNDLSLTDSPEPEDRHNHEDRSEVLKLICLLDEGIGQLDVELQSLIRTWLRANGRQSAIGQWARQQRCCRAKGYKHFQRAKHKLRAYILAREEVHVP
jgi:hypothetical protein